MIVIDTPRSHLSSYRPDIDGLRSIAVLAVVFHHLSPDLLPGGFVGVDIFFVISGFLITSQVYKELIENSFSIREFYKRRINRIVPALATVIAATLAAGFILLSPSDLVLLAKSALASFLGLSNLFFWREYGNYFASNSAEAPLLHTWSLAVEEQFYFFWPLLLVLLIRLFPRYTLALVTVLLLAALGVSEAGTRIAVSASYYLLPTRFFELLVGCLLALTGTRYRCKTPLQAGALFATGMALILSSLFWIDKHSSFPGINALWPCLGSVFLIWSGQQPGSLHKVLTNRTMVFIGLISYSLYLWHWPLIAYLNYLDIRINLVTGLLVFASAVILAWLSWRFVETPARRNGTVLSASKVMFQRLLIPACALAAVNVAVAFSGGLPQRFDGQVTTLSSSLESKPNVLRNGCHVPTTLYDTTPSDTCRIGAPKATADGILIGDSFANHFTGMLDVLGTESGVSLMDFTMDACPPILGYDTGKVAAYADRCIKRNERAFEEIASRKYARVLLAANWPAKEDLTALLSRSIDAVLASGASLTIVLSNERIPRASSCPLRSIMYGRSSDCSSEQSESPAYFATIKAKYPQITFLDPNSVICTEGRCQPVIDNVLLYLDEVHLNDIGSRLIGRRLLALGVKL